MSTIDIPATMRAWLSTRRGPPAKSLTLRNDYPAPTTSSLQKDEVIVKVQAAALNPIGYKIMKYAPNFIAKRPAVPEYDFSGIVVQPNGTKYTAGQPVFGYVHPFVGMKTKQGSLSEYVRVPARFITSRPDNVTPIEAAGLTATGTTAYACLKKVNLEPGQTVFINGGSSAMGAYAIQMAKAQGLRVVVSASGKNEEFVRSLGADEFVDYTKKPLHLQFQENPPSPKFHAILDVVGLVDPTFYINCAVCLAPGGEYISTGAHPTSKAEIRQLIKLLFEAYLRPTWLGGCKRKFVLLVNEPPAEYFDALRTYVEQGQVKPVVDSVYAFEDVLDAYEKHMSGKTRGKLIIKVDKNL